MRSIPSTILFFLLLASCSFKKNMRVTPPVSEKDILIESIQSNDPSETYRKIKSYSVERIQNENLEEQIFETALIRGEVTNIFYLFQLGLSPYRNNSKAYLPSTKYGTLAYASMANYNYKTIQAIEMFISSKDYLSAEGQIKKADLNCEALLTLHSEFNLFEIADNYSGVNQINMDLSDKRQKNFIEFISNRSDCSSLNSSPFKNTWLENEIIRIGYSTDGLHYTSMFQFLISLYKSPTFAFSTDTDASDISLSPVYLIRSKIENSGKPKRDKELLYAEWIQPISKISKDVNAFITNDQWPYYYNVGGFRQPTQQEFDAALKIKYELSNAAGIPKALLKRLTTVIPEMAFYLWSK